MAGHFDVIAFDARGHGSSSNRGGFTIRAVAGDIVAALEALGVGPARFLGISMGGLICARIPEMAPEHRPDGDRRCFASLGEKGPEKVEALEEVICAKTIADTGSNTPTRRSCRRRTGAS